MSTISVSESREVFSAIAARSTSQPQTNVLVASAGLFIAGPVLGTLPGFPGGVPLLTALGTVLLLITIRHSMGSFSLPSFLLAALVFFTLGTHTLLKSTSNFPNIIEMSMRIAILVPIYVLAGVVIGRNESRAVDRNLGRLLAFIGVATSATIWFSETAFTAHRVTMGRLLAVSFVVVALSQVRPMVRIPASFVLFLGLLSSGSRGAFLFGSLAVLGVALFRQGFSARKLLAIQVGVFVIVQQFASTLFDVQETIGSLLSVRSGDKAEDVAFRQAQSLNIQDMLASPSSTVRTDKTFAPAIDQWWENPFSGVGLATGVSPRRGSYIYAHNFLIESASAIGIFGIIGAIFVIVYLLRYAWLDRNAMPVFAGLALFAVMTSLVSGSIAINRELWLMLGVAISRLAIIRSALPVRD